MAILEKDIRTLNKLVELTMKYLESDDTYLFRGQRDSKWDIEAPFDRGLSQNVVEIEKRYSEFFEKFRDEYQFRFPKNVESDDAIMTTGQHYGLKTRLTDWSESAYIALYFAIGGFKSAGSKGKCSLFCLNKSALERQSVSTSLDVIRDVSDQNSRMRLQKGLLIRNKTGHRTIESYLHSLPNATETVLYKYSLGPVLASQADKLLAAVGINHESIYGGLEALTKDVNERHY